MNKADKIKHDIISDSEFEKLIPDEEAAVAFLEERRWKGTPRCPRCGDCNVYRTVNNEKMSHRCRPCRRYFNVLTDTIFHGTQIPIREWLRAIRFVHSSRKGMSSTQLSKHLDISRPAAWHLAARLRKAMECKEEPWLEGIVQVDESWFGGKRKNMHEWQRRAMGDDYNANKMLVQGFRDNKGHYHALPVARPNAKTLRDSVLRYVAPGSEVHTDGEPAYQSLAQYGFRHFWVNHKVGQYVDGQVTINGVESLWALMKRGYIGTYHHIALYHLRRYMAEFTYRLNSGKGQGLRTIGGIMDGAVGRRLKWRVLMGREPADCLANA